MPSKKALFSSSTKQRSGKQADFDKGLSDFVILSLREELRSWYAQMGLDLPWRQTRDPLDRPSCLLCPWQQHCQAFKFNLQSEIPMSEPCTPIPHKLIGVAAIWNDRGEILIDQRKKDGLLGGLWEFPGGKVEPGETVEACIHREIREELGIEIEVGKSLITVDHTYSHFRVSLHVYHCRHLEGDPKPLECDEVRWVRLDELDRFPFPKANVKIIEALKSQQNVT